MLSTPDTPCPSCGQVSLVYVYTRQAGDIYRCAVERGGWNEPSSTAG